MSTFASRTIGYAAGLACAVGLLAGCGAGPSAGDGSSAGGATTTLPSPTGSVAHPSAPVGPTPGSTPTLGAGPRGEPIEVVGTVSVRQGDCLLFTPGDRATSWVLVGEAATDLRPGQGYVLRGTLGEGPSAQCPQGPTFTVSSASPAR